MKNINIDNIARKYLDIEDDIKSQAQKLDLYLQGQGEGLVR